jgi:hypothetical protein
MRQKPTAEIATIAYGNMHISSFGISACTALYSRYGSLFLGSAHQLTLPCEQAASSLSVIASFEEGLGRKEGRKEGKDPSMNRYTSHSLQLPSSFFPVLFYHLPLLLLRKKPAPATSTGVWPFLFTVLDVRAGTVYGFLAVTWVTSPALVQKTVEMLFMPWDQSVRSRKEETKRWEEMLHNGLILRNGELCCQEHHHPNNPCSITAGHYWYVHDGGLELSDRVMHE